VEVYVGRRVKVEKFRAKLPNGAEAEVERVVFPRVVSVLPFDGERVYLIRQYRPALGRYIYEIPGGVLGEGEDPEEGAKRELEEEAGLRARRLVKIFEGVVSPGYSTEYATVYIALGVERSRPNPEPYEVIQVEAVDVEKAWEMATEGAVEDMRTALALLSLKLLKESGRL